MISKINEKIFQAFLRLEEIEGYDYKSDFNTRERKICANIKVYKWIDRDDVNEIAARNTTDEAMLKEIGDEFTDERLNDIVDHENENTVEALKEQYEGNVDLNDFSKIFRVWHKSHNKYGAAKVDFTDDYYINEYWEKSLTFDTYNSWEKEIKKVFDIEYKEWQKRSHINKFECWQYGRSGGWFSVCDVNEVDFNPLSELGYLSLSDLREAYNADDNKKFNEILRENNEGKAKLLSELKFSAKECDDKIIAIESIIKDIERSRDYMKECYLSRLEDEIITFIYDNGKGENCQLMIKEEKVASTLGVTVPFADFKKAWDILQPLMMGLKDGETLPINKGVGKYTVERAKRVGDDVIIKAGCHKISYNNIVRMMI